MQNVNNSHIDTPHDRAQGRESAATSEDRETATAAQKTPENGPEAAGEGCLFTLHVSEGRERDQNTIYKHKIQVKSWEDLRLAARYDHMASAMKNNYRKNENFIGCDCIMTDVDNTHSDDPDKWITADDIGEAFPVKYFSVRSRHYMKPKRVINKKTGEVTIQEPREKWHLYFPLSRPITNNAELENLLINLVSLFPFFDAAAIDPAHMFYGVENPFVVQETGDGCIDEYINALDPEALRTAQRDALDDFISHVLDGSYKNNKGTRNTVKKICEFLKVPNPIPDPDEDAAPAQTADAAGDAPEWIQYAEQERSEKWFLKWAQDHNVELGRRGTFSRSGARTVYYCVTCPWEEEHSMNGAENESVVLIEASGKLSYLCRHSHGAALNWKKYRAYYESKAPAQKPQEGAQDAAQGQERPQEDYLTTFFNRISGDDYKPYKTGLSFFDNLLDGGPVKKTMLLLLAAPAAGKTTLCQQIAESMSEHGKPVLYVNLEMSREQMIAKSLSARCTLAGEPMTTLEVMQGYRWTPNQREAVTNALDQYRERVAPKLDYNPDGITGDLEKLTGYLDRIGERARAAGEPGPVVVLDYLHLLTWPGEDVANVIKKSMQVLKEYAINYDTVSIAISATNRDSNRAGRITMESGRDSSGIEYTGDYILSLNYYQVDQGNVKTSDNDKMAVLTGRPWRQMLLRVLKNRFGIAGRPARVYFHAAGNRFYAEDDFLPEDENIVRFGESDPELDNAGLVAGNFDLNNLVLPETKTPKAGRRR